MRRIPPIIALAATMLVPAAQAGAVTPAAGSATVASANKEPVLRIGKSTVPRPFGAELVDRIAVVGSYRLHDETAYLVRGEAGTTCPARYLIASTKGNGTPSVTPSFGGCTPGGSARVVNGWLVVTVPGPVGAPPARFAYANGVVRPLTTTAAATFTPLSCGLTRQNASTRPFAVALDETFSPYDAQGAVLRRVDYTDEDLRTLVVDLACLSTLPEGEKSVPRRAANLFASKRHGKAAYAALDEVARTPTIGVDVRAAVRSFAAQMHYYVARRTTI